MRFAIALVCYAALSGCYTRVEHAAPPPANQRLIVHYGRPTEVWLIAPGDTGRMVMLRELRGRSQRVSGDTMRMVVSRGRDAEWAPVPAGSIAIVVPAPRMRMESMQLSSRKTINAGIAIVALGVVGYYVVLVAGMMSPNY